MEILEKLKELFKGTEKKVDERPSCPACGAPVVVYREDIKWYFCPSCRHLYST